MSGAGLPGGAGLSEITGSLWGGDGIRVRLTSRPQWWQPGMPEALVELLAEFSYKPRWRFSLRSMTEAGRPGHSFESRWLLLVNTWVEDVTQPGVWSAGVFTIPVPWGDDEAPRDYWLHWLRDQIWQGPERHEVDEWFTVGGERPFDPHAKPGS